MIQQPFREMTHEEERADILAMVGPGRYLLVVHKDVRDAVLAQYDFKPEDVPGLLEAKLFPAYSPPPFEFGLPPPRPNVHASPLPYPPSKRGRYAR